MRHLLLLLVNILSLCFAADRISPVATGHLLPGEALVSPDGSHRLSLGWDSVLTITGSGGNILWHSFGQQPGDQTELLAFQGDGNMVLYTQRDGAVVPAWQSDTPGHADVTFNLSNAGELLVQSASQGPLFRAGPILGFGSGLRPNEALYGGGSLRSPNGRWSLELATTGDLRLVDNSAGSSVKWHIGSNGRRSGFLAMQGDGNLVLYDVAQTAYFSTGTDGFIGGSYLNVQDDGNLVVYSHDHLPLWSVDDVIAGVPFPKPGIISVTTMPGSVAVLEGQPVPTPELSVAVVQPSQWPDAVAPGQPGYAPPSLGPVPTLPGTYAVPILPPVARGYSVLPTPSYQVHVVAQSRVVALSNDIITTVAGGGTQDGDGLAADSRFGSPIGVAVGPSGRVYVVDAERNEVRRFTVGGSIERIAGGGAVPADLASQALDAQFSGALWSIAVDDAERVYVGQVAWNGGTHSRVYRIDGDGSLHVVAGAGTDTSGEGVPAASAGIDFPIGLSWGADGRLYVVEHNAHRIRRIDASANISTVVDGEPPYSAAFLAWPRSVAAMSDGTIYCTDIDQLVRILPDGNRQYLMGSSSYPFSSVVLHQGEPVFNLSGRVIRLSGIHITIAGGGSADPGDGGLAIEARLGMHLGDGHTTGGNALAYDAFGRLFIAEVGAKRIRMVAALPGISVVASEETIAEVGGASVLRISLASVPAQPVTVSLATNNPDQATLGATSLTFTPADWNVPQMVTLSAVDDARADGDAVVQITATGSSQDPSYAGIMSSSVSVIVREDDWAGLVSNVTSNVVQECGPPTAFDLRLNSQPLAPVTVHVMISNPDIAGVTQLGAIPVEGYAYQVQLQFDQTNWNMPQTIWVHGYGDHNNTGHYTKNLDVECVSTSADPSYNGLGVRDHFLIQDAIATVTLSVVPAHREVGQADPPFRVVAHGLPPGVTPESLGAVTFTSGAAADAPEGEYSLTATWAAPAGYDVLIIPSMITVHQADHWDLRRDLPTIDNATGPWRVGMRANTGEFTPFPQRALTAHPGAEGLETWQRSHDIAHADYQPSVAWNSGVAPMAWPIGLYQATLHPANGDSAAAEVQFIAPQDGRYEVDYRLWMQNGGATSVVVRSMDLAGQTTAYFVGATPTQVGDMPWKSFRINLRAGESVQVQVWSMGPFDADSTGADLSIRRLPDPVITWNPTQFVYGQAVESQPAAADQPGSFTYAPSGVLPAGVHEVSATFTYEGGTMSVLRQVTVLPAPLLAVARSRTWLMGRPQPSLVVDYRGFIPGEGPEQLATPVVATTDAPADAARGVYVITAAGGSAANYVITHQPGVLVRADWDAALEISASSNPYGPWSLGTVPPAGPFAPFTRVSDRFGSGSIFWDHLGEVSWAPSAACWLASEPSPVDLLNGELGLHPGNDATATAVRFTAPFSGRFRFMGGLRDQRNELPNRATVGAKLHAATAILWTGGISASDQEVPFDVAVTLSAGEVVDLTVDNGGDGYQGDSTAVRLAVILESRTNDRWADRIPLLGRSGVATGVSSGYTKEVNEQRHAGQVGGASAWWTWTAPFDGVLTLDTAGSSFDTVLAFYAATDSPGMPTRSPSTRTVASNNNRTSTDLTSRVTNVVVTAGAVYHIAVDGVAGAAGSIVLNWSLVPLNDAIARRIVLTGETGVTVRTNLGATRENGEADLAGSGAGRTIWWQWTAPRSGVLHLSTAGSTGIDGLSELDTILGVYRMNGTSAVLTAANDDAVTGERHAELGIKVVAGTVYRFVVDGNRAAAVHEGHIRLNWWMNIEENN